MEGGLRERKKAATRQAISDKATELFSEHGFERVTLAQIAEAADVSVKTIFNYFTSKEELFFDRAEEIFDAIVAAVVARPPGTPVLEALRRVQADRFAPFRDGWLAREPAFLAVFRAFVATEHASPALRARRLVITEAWGARLAPVLAVEMGLEADDARAEILAAMVVAAMAARERVLSGAVLEGAGAAEVERRVRAVVDEAYGRLQRAFGDLERPA